MRNRLLVIGLLLAILLLPMNSEQKAGTDTKGNSDSQPAFENMEYCIIAEAGGTGANFPVTQYMSKSLSDQSLSIRNTYINVDHHNETLDLSPYLIGGWTLYRVDMDVNNLSAEAEREVVGVTHGTDGFLIYKTSTPFTLKVDGLTQGFYNLSHDGSLLNYSIKYRADKLDEPQYYGYAFTVVSSDYTSSSSNITAPLNLTKSTPYVWLTSDGGQANLTADTIYWAVIDGTNLIEFALDDYPTIRWDSELGDGGDFDSRLHIDGTGWQSQSTFEALMNYTYIPWNTTSNTALLFQPEEVEFRANSSYMVDTSWSWQSDSNITQINFDSNQSIALNHNLTLWYKQTTSSSSTWKNKASGVDVDWNLTAPLSYPAGQYEKYANFSKMSDWTGFTSAYNDSTLTSLTPSVLSDTIVISDMTNGTWTLAGEGPNYLSGGVTITDQSTSDLLPVKASITTDLNFTTSIVTSSLNPGVGGTANITIMNSTADVWSDEQTAVLNRSVHLWDIDASTSKNGTYTVEIFWENGTEAGYYLQDYVVYLPTSFDAQSYSISAYTDNSFEIRTTYLDTFTSIALNSSYATVEYSFDGGTNTSMDTDHTNGTYSATIDTTDVVPGTYTVDVYATGFAIENQSLSITVNLRHQTNSLIVQWSNTNSITYPQTTTLQVRYQNTTNNAYISTAEVNVTDGTTTWDLLWNAGSQYFEIRFNGSDVDPGIGLHSLNISAWLLGYEAQYDDTQTLTIDIESTSVVASWSAPHSNSITYVEYTTLQIEYLMSNTSMILGATVNVTDGTTYWNLHWNGTSGYYEIRFNGTDMNPGLGTHTLTIEAWKYGYQGQSPADETLYITDESTGITATWSPPYGNSIDYIQYTVLRVNYTMSNGTTILGALVNVTDGTTLWWLHWNGTSGFYEIQFNGTDVDPGLGTHSLAIEAWKYGYTEQTPAQTLIIQEAGSNISVGWTAPHINNNTYIEYTVLRVAYTMDNGTMILGALVNVTDGTTLWLLHWNGTSSYYEIQFNGTDTDPGFGTYSLTIKADSVGFDGQTVSGETFIVGPEDTNIINSWSAPHSNSITYVEYTILQVEYRMSNGSMILDATVNVTDGFTYWDLHWNGTSGYYEIRFNGTDMNPGLGTHILTIEAWKYGYQEQAPADETLYILEEPTTITASWDTFTISYEESVILRFNYTDSYGNLIAGATQRNLYINGTQVTLLSFGNGTYWYVMDNTWGIGYFEVFANISKMSYEFEVYSGITFTVENELTTWTITWEPANVTLPYTYSLNLSVDYEYSGGDVLSAVVNVTINGDT